MELLRNKMFASVISLVLIGVSVIGLGGNHIMREVNRVSGIFYEEPEGPSMAQSVATIEAQGHNALVILRQELSLDHEVIVRLEGHLSGFDPSSVEGIHSILSQTVGNTEIPQEGLNHLHYMLATVTSQMNIIATRTYHEEVARLNQAMSTGLASQIIWLRGIELPRPFGG